MIKMFRFIKATISKASPVFLVSLCFFIVTACSTAEKPKVYRLEGRTMGTTYHITAVGNQGVRVAETVLQMEVDKKLEEINQIMSTYIPDSELSMLNQAPVNKPVVVSKPLFQILVKSGEITRLSGTAFDVTVGPLVNLWGFGPEERDQNKPDAATLAEARARVGFQFVQLDAERRQVTKTRDVYIDLSAIAKGYGADVLAQLFVDRGFSDYMVEVGGEIALRGNNPAGTPWRIGVEQPTLAQTGVVQAISVPAGGIATSGDYRNYFEVDGQRFSHTIDPKTGEPITHTLASVTVVAPTAAEADALATALNVLGPEKGYELAVKEGVAAYFIIRHENTFVVKGSPEFQQYQVTL